MQSNAVNTSNNAEEPPKPPPDEDEPKPPIKEPSPEEPPVKEPPKECLSWFARATTVGSVKTIQIKEFRAMDLRFAANNVFNSVRYTSINTVVNSLTFGEVTGAGTMRRVTLTARFRF